MYEQDSSPTSLSDFITQDPRETHGPIRAAYDARRAIYTLLGTSNSPAILVAREWRVVKGDYKFEHLQVYEKVAVENGCCVVALMREMEGGIEHLLLIARQSGISEAELLSCITIGPTRPMGAHIKWA